MPLQGLTIAMSLSGIQYLFQTSLQPSIASALQNMTLPTPNIGLPSPLFIGNFADAAAVPYPPVDHGPTYWAVNVNVNLTNGRLSNFRPTFNDLTQGADGEFTVKMSAENVVVDYNWNESYREQKCPAYKDPTNAQCDDQGGRSKVYPYSMCMGSWSVDIVFKLQYSANVLQLALVNSKSTPANLSPNIPSDSIVRRTGAGSCATPAIVTNTEAALKNIAFGEAVKGALTQVFQTIRHSGQITPDIAFDFSMGPSGITFPGNSGLATGVAGTATWKGTVYPNTNTPQLTVPLVPTDHHLNYLISDYSVNALFWAFFSAGLLEVVATPENTGGNTSLLNTRVFNGSSAHIIYDKYRNAPMTADIKACTTPTVAIQQVYEPTAVALNKARPPLPQPILDNLQGLITNIYVSEPSFFTDLVNFLGEADADRYKTAIENASLSFAAVVTHKNRVVMNVRWKGATIPVLTYDVCETDTLDAFVLAHSGTTQTLQFVPTVIPQMTTAKLFSSPFHGIDANGFAYVYNNGLQPLFDKVAKAVGKAGVALPRTQGFNFVFDRATIDLEQGYANVLTDVMHTGDNGTLYFQSKQRPRPAGSHVAPASVRKNWGELPPARPLLPPPVGWPHLIQSS
jgi:hypothetical protein